MLDFSKTTGRDFDVLTLGEIMLRLSPPNNERILRGDVFEKRAGGSELNVASGISLLGLRTGVITKLPRNAIGSYIKNRVRYCGVSDDYIVYDDDPEARLGIYYYENGALPRKPAVVYDRRNSSVTRLRLEELPDSVYGSCRIFHTSGITLALSDQTCFDAVELMKRMKAQGTVISFDVNYRANLWSEADARRTIEAILPLVDILFVSEETSRRMFGKTGTKAEMMKSYCTDFGVSVVATTERTAINPHKHNFTSTIYSSENDAYYEEPPYLDIEVVDRIGSGDAYVAGVLFGLLYCGNFERALEFGNAASALKNTIPGDLPSSDYEEVSRIIREHKNHGIQSEMTR